MSDTTRALSALRPLAGLLAVILAIGGCATNTVAPSPSLAIPATWNAAIDTPGKNENATAAWWRQAGSTELADLIEQALRNNRDLRAAAARVLQARALTGEVDSELQPQLNGVAAVRRGRDTLLDPRSTSVRAGLQASWEADLFGAKKLASQAAQLDSERAELARQGMETAISAEVATSYLDAAILARRVRLGELYLDKLDQATRIAGKQFDAGHLSRPEVLSRERQHKAALIEQANLESSLLQRMIQLGVLLGVPAGDIKPRFQELDRLTLPAPDFALPGELLERRPDVQQHLKAVNAEAARLGISRREIYPRLVFAWDNSLERARIDGDSPTRGVALGYGVTLTLPILDGGRIRSHIQVSEARLTEAMAGYEKAMLEALADAETVLLRQKAAAATLALSKDALTLAAQSTEKTTRQFHAGQADRSRIVDAELAELKMREAHQQALGSHWATSVDVLRAFSGPIDVATPAETTPSL